MSESPVIIQFYNYFSVSQVYSCRPICSYLILLLMIQLSLYMMMFYVNYTDLENMLKLIFH